MRILCHRPRPVRRSETSRNWGQQCIAREFFWPMTTGPYSSGQAICCALHSMLWRSAANGEDLIREAKLLNPDVIVADITMPIVSGIEAAHELREAGSSAKFIFLTVHQQTEFLDACWSEGALGYVVKSRMYTDLIPAIEKVLAGEQFVSPVVFQ